MPLLLILKTGDFETASGRASYNQHKEISHEHKTMHYSILVSISACIFIPKFPMKLICKC